MKVNLKQIEKIKKKTFRDVYEYRKSFCDYPDFWTKEKKIATKIKEKIINQTGLKDKLIFSNFNQMPEKEVLLYFHFPFCSSMCLFCNVLKLLPPNKKKMLNYIDYLKRELDLYLNNTNLKEKTVKALYFGGGTPAEMPNEGLLCFVNYLKKNLKFDQDFDFTIEAHPKIINSPLGLKILNNFKKSGVNRISLGIQSFNDLVLKINHRNHTLEEAIRSVKILKNFGFILNIDMMFGLPGQNYQDIQKYLKVLEKLKPSSIEYFRLEHVNPKLCLLYDLNKLLFVSEDDLWEMNKLIYQWLLKNNYEQNGTLEENNQNYRYRYFCLKSIPYLGFGRGAASHFKSLRFINMTNLKDYYQMLDQKNLPVAIYYQLNKKEQAVRDFYYSLQLKRGVDKYEFRRKYGFSTSDFFGSFIKNFKNFGLIVEDKKFIKLSDLGTFFVSDICFSLTKYADKKIFS